MVEIIFDSEQTSCRALLAVFFQGEGMVPPTGPDPAKDVAHLHRTAILELSPEERYIAQGAYARVDAGGLWTGNVIW